ncbi:MAG: hypothetical protein HC796_05250 [Synechococcaceae cyanobacterium RL_1_2]|nr:hypothetical protein [Synechococcaceae cyanobacterium RL_1_2]
MEIEQLRQRHPRLIYEAYRYQIVDQQLQVSFELLLEPNIRFTPAVTLPISGTPTPEELEIFAFHLGLVELISYWKCACSPEILIKAGPLSPAQIEWFRDLFIHGLGEFYFINQIDFRGDDFLRITVDSDRSFAPLPDRPQVAGTLILVAGGKDSSVTLEVLKDLPGPKQTFALNPTRSTLDSVTIAGYEPGLVAHRTIDRQLIELNHQGYLNGHTPFSAYLAFLSSWVAYLHGFKYVVASNENSANEQNVIFKDLEINHQYSKTFRFEQRFRAYAQQYLSPQISYFSVLRPLLDLQIAGIFSLYKHHHHSFRSCNVNQRQDSWCCQCPKCAFVYLSLFNFLPYEEMLAIFGEDLYLKPEIQDHFLGLAELGGQKPFECVGTVEESRFALALSGDRYLTLNQPLPDLIHKVRANTDPIATSLVHQWQEGHNLPPDHEQLLKQALDRVQVY